MADPRRAALRWRRATIAIGVVSSVAHLILIWTLDLNVAVAFVTAVGLASGRFLYWRGYTDGQDGEVPDHG